MGGVYRIQTILGFLNIFLYLQGPLPLACTHVYPGDVWDTGRRFAKLLLIKWTVKLVLK